MSTDERRLDELVAELDDDADRAGSATQGFVDNVVATARWQQVLKNSLDVLEKLVESIAAAAKLALGGKDDRNL
ncbi:MAG: hypothetical protein OEM67_06990 [Thermoleophilia bacterium]|nr:hypothetical protein [Thermoleophilia bacterium]MDH3725040.1 hypothetical protein [Thermoleophilia bacterium]